MFDMGSSGLRVGMKITGSGTGSFSGTWSGLVLAESGGTTSDINYKHEITPLASRYSLLFDNLVPCTYKYNDGTSDRLHTGFIAQEVKRALDIANISTKDFAGLIITDMDTEQEKWHLRYEEFIALNTWQIQQLKSRVAYLEDEIKQIKTQLKI